MISKCTGGGGEMDRNTYQCIGSLKGLSCPYKIWGKVWWFYVTSIISIKHIVFGNLVFYVTSPFDISTKTMVP